MGKKKLICVMGETCSGKDTYISRLCSEYPELFKAIVSYTDRPMRSTEKDGREHWFLSKEEFTKKYESSKALAYTKIQAEGNDDGYRYMATLDQLDECNVYCIDPNGVQYLKENFPEIELKIILIWAPYVDRLSRAELGRNDLDNFINRCDQEEEQFNRCYSKGEFHKSIINRNAPLKYRELRYQLFVHYCMEFLFEEQLKRFKPFDSFLYSSYFDRTFLRLTKDAYITDTEVALKYKDKYYRFYPLSYFGKYLSKSFSVYRYSTMVQDVNEYSRDFDDYDHHFVYCTSSIAEMWKTRYKEILESDDYDVELDSKWFLYQHEKFLDHIIGPTPERRREEMFVSADQFFLFMDPKTGLAVESRLYPPGMKLDVYV